MERWQERLEVGITVRYKYDEKLFRLYTRNACERKVTECQFADDAALLASTRAGAKRMAVVYQRTSDDFGLTVSIPKTKHMAAGRLVDESDQEPIALVGGDVVALDDFPHLGRLWEDGCGRRQESGAGVQGFWCPKESCLSGQEFEPGDQEEAVQCLCTLRATLRC